MENPQNELICVSKQYNTEHSIFQDQSPLFSFQNQQNRIKRQINRQIDGGDIENNQVIDEELLQKMSKLHQTLRNKKLLQFQLIQAQIMKKNRLKDCQAIQKQREKLTITIDEIQIENRSNQADIQVLKNSIEAQRTKNKEYLKKKQEINHKTMKLNLRKQQLRSKNKGKSNKYEQGRFISVEKIRLQAENRSKNEIIQQIKQSIKQMKLKIAEKQNQNMELQQQQQLLIKQIKAQKNMENKKQKQKVENSKDIDSNKVCNKQIHNLSLCHSQKENNFNLQNIKETKSQLENNKSSVKSTKRHQQKIIVQLNLKQIKTHTKQTKRTAKSLKTKKKQAKAQSIR